MNEIDRKRERGIGKIELNNFNIKFEIPHAYTVILQQQNTLKYSYVK